MLVQPMPHPQFPSLIPEFARLGRLWLPAVAAPLAPTVRGFFEKGFKPAKAIDNKRHKALFRCVELHVLPYFGARRLDEVARPDVERWLAGLATGYAPGSVRYFFSVLKSLFNLAVAEGVIGRSPCRGVKAKVPGKKRPALGQEESLRLVRYLQSVDDPRATALLLLYRTAARKSEILKASWENVDWARGILWIPHPKSLSGPRAIYLPEGVTAILRKLGGHPGREGYIFPSARKPGKPISDLWYFWDKVRGRLGLNGFRIHDLRHAAITLMSHAGVKLENARLLAGHTRISTTVGYYSENDEVMHREAERLDAAIMGKTKI